MALTQAEFYIIEPSESTNIVTNPSFETATTGYTVIGGSTAMARTATQQRRGVYGLDITPTNNALSGVYYGNVALTNGVAYTFSVDVKDVNGQSFSIYFSTTGGVLKGTATTWTGTGHWRRKSVSWTCDSTTNYRLVLVRGAVASTTHFYTDGWQCEVGAETTYLDGDLKGFVRGETAYRWLGTPHASQSWRSGQTRSGGTMLRIKDYARIISVLGLGMANILNIAQPLNLDYSSYQTSHVRDREVIFNLAFSGADLGEIQADRQELIDAVRPDRVARKQPIVIRYQGLDASGVEASEPVNIYAHYVDGLDDQPKKPGIEMANVRFNVYLPFVSRDGDTAVNLGTYTTVANTNYIAQRNSSGTWSALDTGTAGDIFALAMANDGSLYVGGGFTSASGVANTGRIAKWDGSAWSALGTGTNAQVLALAIGPDGSLYAGGNFASMGGVANTAYIAKWNGSTWSALGTGMNDSVFAIAFGPDGSLYAGGNFTLAGGVANTAYIAKWNGSAWSALGTGMNDSVQAIAVAKDNTLYATGSFTTANGVSAARIAKWNGTTFEAMGTGLGSAINHIGRALAFGADGTLYVGGSFPLAGGVAGTSYVAKWNGASWSPLGSGVDGSVRSLFYDPVDGLLYLGGFFTEVSGVVIPDRAAIWNGSSFTAIDADLPGTPLVMAVQKTANGTLYLGYDQGGSSSAATITTATLSGSSRAYPKITFTGPGTLWQIKNYTTGKTVYFSGLTLNAGETAIMDFYPGRFSFISSFRGNMSNYITGGSDLDFYLQPGANNISAFMTGTTAASSIVATWQDLYWSIDGAKR